MSTPQATSSLVKATVSAVIIAAVALITIILPAEYNLDPTGIGRTLGLTVLSQAQENNIKPASSETTDSGYNTHEANILVPAGGGVEYKFNMAQFAKMHYQWITEGEAVYVDLHGEPEGDTSGYFESYVIATVADMQGSFTAPFAGSHGWYFKNTSDSPINVTLVVSGQFDLIGLN